MDFKQRFQGRSGFINKQGNIIEENTQKLFPLQKSPNFQSEGSNVSSNFINEVDQSFMINNIGSESNKKQGGTDAKIEANNNSNNKVVIKQNVTIINNQSTIFTNHNNQGNPSNIQVHRRHRKFNSLGNSIDYGNATLNNQNLINQNDTLQQMAKQSINEQPQKRNNRLDHTVIYESQSLTNSPLKLKRQFDNATIQQNNDTDGVIVQKQLVNGRFHLNKKDITSQRSSVDQLQHLNSHIQQQVIDSRDSLIGSPLSDKTFKSQPQNYDSFYYRFSEFKTKIQNTNQLVRSNQSITVTKPSQSSNEPMNKTAFFGKVETNNLNDSSLPSIFNKKGEAKNYNKVIYSAPNPSINKQSRYLSDQKQKNHDGLHQNVSIRLNKDINITKANNIDQSTTFNTTFALNQQQAAANLKKSRVNKVQATINTVQVDNNSEIEKLKQQEANVKNINSNKKAYQAYSINDYNQLQNMYEQTYKRLGGLGPNIGSEDWQQKKNKNEKIIQYAQQLKTLQNI